MIVGIDPGKATGIAVWRNGAIDWDLTGEYSEVQVYEFLDRYCGLIHHAQVEWFTISERTIKTDIDYTALHLIGAITYSAWRCEHPVQFTYPSDVKAQFPDAALRKAGMWHSSDHARDALRHLCRYLVVSKVLEPRAFLLDESDPS